MRWHYCATPSRLKSLCLRRLAILAQAPSLRLNGDQPPPCGFRKCFSPPSLTPLAVTLPYTLGGPASEVGPPSSLAVAKAVNRVRASLDKGYREYRNWRRKNQADSSDEELSWQDDETRAAGLAYTPSRGMLHRLKKAKITKSTWSVFYPGRKPYEPCAPREREVHNCHWELIKAKRARSKDPNTWSDTSEEMD